MTKFLKAPYDYIASVKKKQDKIYIMIRPEYENTIMSDNTIIPHLEEAHGKENIIYVPFDENKITSEKYLPMESIFTVINRNNYFFKVSNEL